MGRRPSLLDPPGCPRVGHEDRRVTFAAGQMFKCLGPDGSSHGFAGTLPPLIADGEVCQRCDNEAHRHQGPLLTRDHEFHLRLAAKRS